MLPISVSLPFLVLVLVLEPLSGASAVLLRGHAAASDGLILTAAAAADWESRAEPEMGHPSINKRKDSSHSSSHGMSSGINHSRVALHSKGKESATTFEALESKALSIRRELDDRRITCQLRYQALQETLVVVRAELVQLSSAMAGNQAAQGRARNAVSQAKTQRDKMKMAAAGMRTQCEEQLQHAQSLVNATERDVEGAKVMKGLAPKCSENSPTSSSSSNLLQQARDVAGAKEALLSLSIKFSSSWATAEWKLLQTLLKEQAPSQCTFVRAQIRKMAAGVTAAYEKSKEALASVNDNCQKEMAAQQARMAQVQRAQSDAAASLSDFVAEKASLEAQQISKEEEQQGLEKSLADSQKECALQIDQLRVMLQENLKLRQALKAGARDCSPGPWQWSTCSQDCKPIGGKPGSKNGTRYPLVEAEGGGLECKLLETTLECGSNPCPQDCQLSSWESWSACSAMCGGGTQARTRQVVKPPRNGGQACLVTEERRGCAMMACESSCELSDWSDWSACSRSCHFDAGGNPGQRTRARTVLKAGANCPVPDDPRRFKEEPCNTKACVNGSTCTGTEDVIFLLDGSAAADFSSQLALARGIINGSSPDMHFAAIAYGSQPKVLASLTNKRDRLFASLSKLEDQPGGDPKLAPSLVLASKLVEATGYGDGRIHDSRLVVLSDGAPSDILATSQEVKELRSEGRSLLVGLVGASMKDTVCSWLGKSCDEHLEVMNKWEELPQLPLRFLAALCSSLAAPAPMLQAAAEAAATTTAAAA